MKYIFIVQGEGRGHITQAITLSELLRRNGHEVLEVLTGKSKNREIPPFFFEKIGASVSTFETPSFILKKNRKNIHIAKTILYNMHPKQLNTYHKSIEFIYKRIQKLSPDVILNFYEPLIAVTCLKYNLKIPIISIGHQFLFKHPDFKFANFKEKNILFFRLFTHLCQTGSSKILALSFYDMNDCPAERLLVVPPLVRQEVRTLIPSKKSYILGYLTSIGFEKEVREWHKKHPETELHFFQDRTEDEYRIDKTLTLHAVNDVKFLEYMAECRGFISTAGFESVCEAMYLDKSIMLVPFHVEQEINALDAASTGSSMIAQSFNISLLLDFIEKRNYDVEYFKKWVDSAEEIFLKQLTDD